MTCPFLRESRVRYCRTASVRKLIPIGAEAEGEKCASAAHEECAVYRGTPTDEATGGPCPYRRESLMQYCGAAPVPRFIPYSESLLSRCGTDSHRYCELYLGMAHPEIDADEVDGIAVPSWLQYSANHMWLDQTEDGVCHAGIDGFLSRTLGEVERLTFVWQSGCHRPTAVITAGGVDLELVFPNNLLITACNLYLRADPARLTNEPYSRGWLFQGAPVEGTAEGLRNSDEARGWMAAEQRRMNEFLQQQSGGGQYAADGGQFATGVVHELDRERTLALFHEFFSPFASGKR